MASLTIALGAGCKKEPEVATKPATAQAAPPAAASGTPLLSMVRRPAPQIVTGTALMQKDRTLVFLLRAQDAKGRVGYARKVYKPTHEKYGRLLRFLGNIRPGQRRQLPAFRPRARGDESTQARRSGSTGDDGLKTIAIQ